MAGWIVATLVAATGACSSVPFHRFADVAPPAPDQGDVFLYRLDARWASSEVFDVFVDDALVGRLPNASVLWMRLYPGAHQLSVVPGATRHRAESLIRVDAGQRHLLQYDFATRTMANEAFIGSAIRWRADLALDDLPRTLTLVGAACEPGCPPRPLRTGNRIPIDDADAVPGLDAGGRAGYRAWLRRAPPRAFVVADDGRWHASWGYRSVERAIQQCRDGGYAPCRLYAVDHRVVWETPH
ncbi:MAG: DUF2846 domain-containing protein [Burkholderiaceae bacterium]